MTERTYTADEVDAMIARALAREREKSVQQEPVAFSTVDAFAWGDRQSERVVKLTRKAQPEHGFTAPLYTRPQAREWVGLTPKDIEHTCKNVRETTGGVDPEVLAYALEAKLKEKNA